MKIKEKILHAITRIMIFLTIILIFFSAINILGYKDIYIIDLVICSIVSIIVETAFILMTKRYDNQEESKDEYRKYLIEKLDDTDLEKSSPYISKNDNSEKPYIPDITIFEERKSDKRDIIALMLKNNDEITDYFKISKSQAKSSFWFSVISCVAGLLALMVGIYGIVVLKDISISVISLISGSISELISGTIFWVHSKSALQLNHYYDALHENEKFLSAINIADKLSDEKREEMLIEIILKQINSETSKSKIEDIEEKGKNKENQKHS